MMKIKVSYDETVECNDENDDCYGEINILTSDKLIGYFDSLDDANNSEFEKTIKNERGFDLVGMCKPKDVDVSIEKNYLKYESDGIHYIDICFNLVLI